ncbi:MAG: aminotransferase, partial [Alphaproteobacteria bacterium]|nr:aminotransferase [Alphaproteobacteria bacterium]
MAKRSNSLASRDIAHLIHGYTNLDAHLEKGPLVIERGKGIYVYDEDGKEYIEGMAGLWCAGLGFGEEELVEAAAEQMRKLPYYHGFTHKSTPTSILLAEKLKQIAPADFSKVFFVNSGSEANDTQIKLVWYYNNAIGRPQKKKIISRIRGYHGVTVASASLTGLPMLHTDFDLPIAGILHTATPHHYREAWPGETEEEFASRLAGMLEAMIIEEGPDTVAAFIAEPIMGAGGVIVPPATYFPKIQAVCTKYDVLFIADEVICGFGRTGNVWGSQTFGIKPDLLSCAKQLSASYLPIAACLINEDVYQAMLDESRKVGTFGHGYTYSGHPVPAAVALKALELYETRGIYDHVKKVSPRF